MNIYVNGEKIGFQLEGEKNCYDIAIGIQKWAETQNKFLRQIIIEDKTYYQPKEELKNIPVTEQTEIGFTVVSAEVLALEALNDTLTFFTNLRNLDKENVTVKDDLPDVIQWCSNVIAKSKIIMRLDYNTPIEGTTINTELGKLDNFIEKLKQMKGHAQVDIKKAILSGIDIPLWEKILTQVVAEAKNNVPAEKASIEPSDIIRKLQADNLEIPEIVIKIEKVSSELHTGNDAEAMQKLNEISQRLAQMIQHLQLCDTLIQPSIGSMVIDEVRTVGDELLLMTEIFKQIIEGFDNKDIILICDLLEYELSPKLQTLSRINELVIMKLKESYH